MPSFIPQGSGSTTAEAGVAPMAPRPATPAAAPKKPRREVSIFMDLFLLFLKVNSTPPRTALCTRCENPSLTVGARIRAPTVREGFEVAPNLAVTDLIDFHHRLEHLRGQDNAARLQTIVELRPGGGGAERSGNF